MHSSAHSALYTRREELADHDHHSAKFPIYRSTGGALVVPLATPAQPNVVHHYDDTQQAWWKAKLKIKEISCKGMM